MSPTTKKETDTAAKPAKAKAEPKAAAKAPKAETPAAKPAAKRGKSEQPATVSGKYCVAEISGKQYQLAEGRYIDVDLLSADPDAALTFDKVLYIQDGDNATVGLPYIAGASVTAKVLEHRKGPKVIVYKMRPKKGYRLKNGHRQQYTRIQVEAIAQ